MTTQKPLAVPLPGGPKTVEVIKTEEKGSDVNLASYLLADAFRSDAEAFVLISNDSDLMEPLRMVRHELHKVAGLLNPQARQSRALLRCKPTFVKQIRPGVVSVSQLPNQLADRWNGEGRKTETPQKTETPPKRGLVPSCLNRWGGARTASVWDADV